MFPLPLFKLLSRTHFFSEHEQRTVYFGDGTAYLKFIERRFGILKRFDLVLRHLPHHGANYETVYERN
jgi:hypothetical protein